MVEIFCVCAINCLHFVLKLLILFLLAASVDIAKETLFFVE